MNSVVFPVNVEIQLLWGDGDVWLTATSTTSFFDGRRLYL